MRLLVKGRPLLLQPIAEHRLQWHAQSRHVADHTTHNRHPLTSNIGGGGNGGDDDDNSGGSGDDDAKQFNLVTCESTQHISTVSSLE